MYYYYRVAAAVVHHKSPQSGSEQNEESQDNEVETTTDNWTTFKWKNYYLFLPAVLFNTTIAKATIIFILLLLYRKHIGHQL